MNTSTRTAGRNLWVSVRTLAVLTLLLGGVYLAVVTGVGRLVLPEQADGALVRSSTGEVVGSRLIGQAFTDADGDAMPGYFQSRPSAAGDGYDGAASGGSNLGPESADLREAIAMRRAAIAAREGVAESAIPPDAVTASASGLDPHISPAYAALQVERVARERGLPVDEVRRLVEQHTERATWGYLGAAGVNVLALNLALGPEPDPERGEG